MSAGVKKPNVTIIEVPLEIKLSLLFRISPGDPCPDETCDGHISNVRFSWDLSGLDGHGECSKCLEKWTTVEVPSYGDIHDGDEDKEAP